MRAFGFIEMLLVALGGGGTNGLVDLLPTEAYWKAKRVTVSVKRLVHELDPAAAPVAKPDDIPRLVRDLGAAEFAVRQAAAARLRALGALAAKELAEAAKSDDPEVSMTARELLKNLKAAKLGPGGPKAKAIRRLMAIRTLGELKDPEALPVLRPLLDSKEPFVADFARKAIAAIEGKPFRRTPLARELLHADLCLLPRNCGVVGQMSLIPTPSKPVDATAALPPFMQAGDMKEKLVQGLLTAAELVGNVRVDHLTMGVADDVGDDTGYVAFVARGLYDPAAVKAACQLAPRFEALNVDGVEVLAIDKHARLIPCGPGRLVAVFGPSPEAMPVQALAAAVKAKPDKLALDPKLLRLLEPLDITAPLWAVARMSAAYRQADFLAPFDDATLTGKAKGEGLGLTLVARGTDPAAVKAVADRLTAELDKGKAQMGQMLAMMPALKPVAEFVRTIKIETHEAKATLSAHFENQSAMLLMPMMLFMGHAVSRPMLAPDEVPMEQMAPDGAVPRPR